MEVRQARRYGSSYESLTVSFLPWLHRNILKIFEEHRIDHGEGCEIHQKVALLSHGQDLRNTLILEEEHSFQVNCVGYLWIVKSVPVFIR